MKYCVAISLVLNLLVTNVSGQSYYTHRTESAIKRFGEDGTVFKIDKPITRLDFDPSPAGKLIYIENLDPQAKSIYERTYSSLTGEALANYTQSGHAEYNPDLAGKKLHILNAGLEDIQDLVIPQRFGALYNLYARFLGENFLIMNDFSRKSSPENYYLFDLVRDSIFMWDWRNTISDPKFYIAPNGLDWLAICGHYLSLSEQQFSVAKALDQPGAFGNFVYYDGKLLFPFCDVYPKTPADEHGEYETYLTSLHAKSEKLAVRFHVLDQLEQYWTKDSHYILLPIETKPSEHAGDIGDVSLVIVNTQLIQNGADFHQYSLTVPLNEANTVRPDPNPPPKRPRQPEDQIAPHIQLDETTNTLTFWRHHPAYDSPIRPVTYSLPSNWRQATDAALGVNR